MYWEVASKKVPVDAVKVPKEGEYLEFEVKGKVARVPAWEWRPAPGVKLSEVRLMRFCFYGKGAVRPWDECENFAPTIKSGKALCETGHACEYSADCPKFRLAVGYIA